MATHSKGISALQVQAQLGIGSDKTAWLLYAKLRRTMVAPGREPLAGRCQGNEADNAPCRYANVSRRFDKARSRTCSAPDCCVR